MNLEIHLERTVEIKVVTELDVRREAGNDRSRKQFWSVPKCIEKNALRSIEVKRTMIVNFEVKKASLRQPSSLHFANVQNPSSHVVKIIECI